MPNPIISLAWLRILDISFSGKLEGHMSLSVSSLHQIPPEKPYKEYGARIAGSSVNGFPIKCTP